MEQEPRTCSRVHHRNKPTKYKITKVYSSWGPCHVSFRFQPLVLRENITTSV
ncbi:hypothetical protein F2Q70_00007251 [Brassica cretica]|uniref:Uncharacterized protein n=1 Tax=Brassica cretica TaxID=69181 RepID=A0A8S9M416_BRACR|nr:hypothetical protein F2Q70_00007251 [Brassica cretica]